MRKYYLDNIRWITVVLVVVYHVIYMYNGIITDGVIGPFYEKQYQDALQYILHPWFMIVLFIPASNEPGAVLARAFGECREGQIPSSSAAHQA